MVMGIETEVKPQHRIGYIDGLRAVAVLTVVWSHAYGANMLGQSFGVALFFVISGFCLAFPTLVKLREHNAASFDVYRYAARRVVRIVPPYWIAIALLFAASIFVSSPPSLVHASLLDVVRQMLFVDRNTTLLTGPFWSLPVEFRWYFLFPVALWLWVKSPRAFVAVALALVIIGNATNAWSVDVLMLPALLLGIVAAQIQIDGHRYARFALPASAVAFAVAYWKTGFLISPLWELGVFLFTVGAGSTAWFRKALSFRGITAIGLVSYSIYLVFAPIVALALARGIHPIATIALGVAGGFVFWCVAERPFLNTNLRNRMVADFTETFAKWFPRIGIGRDLRLTPVGKTNGGLQPEIHVGDVAVCVLETTPKRGS